MTFSKKQNGFLSMIAVMMIILFGLLGSALIYLFINKSISVTHLSSQVPALSMAETALEEGLRLLRLPTIANNTNPSANQRQSCLNLSNTQILGNGSATVQRAFVPDEPDYPVNPLMAFSTLDNTIGTSISLTNSSALAPSGRIYIEREAIDYGFNDTVSNTLSELSRAVDGTQQSTHPIGTIVSQYLCTLKGTGLFPQVNPFAKRDLLRGAQLQAVYAVGNSNTHIQWNTPTELQWQNSQGNPQNRTYYSVDILNAHQGWAVGARSGNSLIFNHLNQGAWVNVSLNVGNSQRANLYGVSAVSSQEAWAVGQRRSAVMTLWRWMGGADNNWCRIETASSCGGKIILSQPNTNQRELRAISVIDTTGDGLGNIGFAVGGPNNQGVIMQYNGTQWFNVTALPAQTGRLYGVLVMPLGTASSVEAWAVGLASNSSSRGKILRFNGAQWQLSYNASTNQDRDIRAISMIDTTGDGRANYGWAVGRGGRNYEYINGSWSRGSNLSGTLNSVTVITETDAWIVGQSGRRYHWDGSSWTNITVGNTTGQELRGVSSVSARSQPATQWRELNN